jgi:hypothetical protein
MATSEPETEVADGDQVVELEQGIEGEVSADEARTSEETMEQKQGLIKRDMKLHAQGDRASFVHGLSVGLGLGCIATFVVVWIAIYFTPLLPSTITYENMLAIFVFPLIYLLAVGLVALTAGIVRQYFVAKR